ncbi:MAG: peptidoglycan DD-metalloendopeptidase family protein [Spirochaetes bacterium]|nr:peptidoglycan DD-metalloendopeptidase family protein [Spirochaetota bacterium]
MFISPDSIVPDPFDSQMLNRYMYVRGNPVKYTDPDGRNPLIAMGVSFAIGYLSHGAQTGNWGMDAIDAGAKACAAGFVGAWTGGITSIIVGTGPVGQIVAAATGGAAGGATGAALGGGNVGYGALAGMIGGGLGVLANQSGIPIIQEDVSSAIIGGAVGGGAGSAMAGGNFWEGFASGAAGAVGGYLGTAALGGLPDARKAQQKSSKGDTDPYWQGKGRIAFKPRLQDEPSRWYEEFLFKAGFRNLRLSKPTQFGGKISSYYGNRLLNGGSLQFHPGIDIKNPWFPLVSAAASGTVRYAGWGGRAGWQVEINHGRGHYTAYFHMMKSSLMVKTGDYVYRGQPLGIIGNSGYSFGPHLHFGLRINGWTSWVNPNPYFIKGY